jgi:hypothetical protein
MPKRILEGVVVSDKMDKTVVVEVERRVQHPVYKKFIRRSKRYHAHDEFQRHQGGRDSAHHRKPAAVEDQAVGCDHRGPGVLKGAGHMKERRVQPPGR